MVHTHGVDSEVGRLRTVLAHRPGAELRRITPRTQHGLLFHGLPWVGRAQQEHDVLAQVLRDHGVQVLYVTELLQDVLEYPSARTEAIDSVTSDPRLGEQLRGDVVDHLAGLDPESLAQVMVSGLAQEEFRRGRGVVYGLLDRHEFVIPPLSNLVFLRDSSVWIGAVAVVTSLPGGVRSREPALMRILYRHHPRFTGTTCVYGPDLEPLDGGDVLLLAPGVVAVGVGDRTTPAGVERLALRLFAAGAAQTVVAVPMRHLPAGISFDTVCTVIGDATLVMSPALAYTLQAHVISAGEGGLAGKGGLAGEGGLRVSRPRPFLEAAAKAMGTDSLTVISTGLYPPAASGQQWDDGGNALAIEQGLVVCHERNVDTNARLEAAGIDVIRVPGSELGSERGGPRGMSCPVSRDPVAAAGQVAASREAAATLAPPEPAITPAPPGPATTPAAPAPTTRIASAAVATVDSLDVADLAEAHPVPATGAGDLAGAR